ncbi:glutaminase A [Acanthopleuribacter pedis]|uniref:Glutaminase n=1 Tax=Acanthopleuribacter pedis TaxID=442870 RepID=A0A8J7QAN6_9BACT|nr:glutaminase A [Acanthopleuribacter pedis]MBO1320937.1 glutaminase A [Acanthopleuribacter pedis]
MLQELQEHLEWAFAQAEPLKHGKNAGYIPALAEVDPERFSACICTTSGEIIRVGEDNPFTLQSMSKPFLYAEALATFGIETVHQHVAVEPTGKPFDALIDVQSGSKRPHNPMINAGAIAIASLFAQGSERDQVRRLDHLFGRYLGRTPIQFNTRVYLNERDTAFGNRALAHLMNHFGMLGGSVEAALDFYFKACSLQLNCRDLSVMAATLANGGRHPLTGRRVLPGRYLRDTLTVQATCGLYDYSGRFWFDVGVPAKSGVSGGIFAVVPGKMGIAVYAPRLDENGNSVRGLSLLKSLSQKCRFHVFDHAPPPAPVTQPRPAPLALEWALKRAANLALCNRRGQISDFTPDLMAADPNALVVSLCTVDGREVHLGTQDTTFLLQAAATPFTYLTALDRFGMAAVHQKIGVEPSGNPFHAVQLDPKTNLPYNPLANAGALCIANMLACDDAAKRLQRLLDNLNAMAGRGECDIDLIALAAERTAGERNRAIACLLKKFDLIDNIEATLELYFLQNSIRTNTATLARMAATLAAAGRNPFTGRQIVDPRHVPPVLTVMSTCGLHDGSGWFAYDVGLPAKSGVSGAILAVAPGRMGVAVYAPLIDKHGTSERGKTLLATLARDLGLRMFTTGITEDEPG